ncbi:SpaA isopeptide-forming pilin-related protein [Faecalibaculum rodentium]|uniref:SpaA isopeptide-forming pilin-related protein n=1 Tax=Faecalibaculum rodentium TaxID=1702221 RepID=UPI003F678951
MNKLRTRIKSGVMSLLVAAGAILPSVTPIMAQDDPDPKLTITVEGSGSVQISEKDSEKFQFALSESPFEELIKEGTMVELECTGDGQVVKELTVDNKIQDLEYGQATLDFEFKMPTKDSNIKVIFEAAEVEQNKKTGSVEEEKPGEPDEQKTTTDKIVSEDLNFPKGRQFQLTEEEQAVIDQYKSGDYQGGLSLRKKIAEEYGLTSYVDKDFFLTEDFFQNFGFHSLSWGGILILSPYEKPGFEPQTFPTVRSTGNVTKMDTHTWYYGGGGFMNGGLWTVSVPTHGSQMAFCANGMQSPPPAGTTLDTPVKQNNENLRKALYYGYGGPQNRLTNYNTAQQVIFTNDLVSMANTGKCMSGEIGGGWIWNQYVSSIWNQLQSWPSPPANYVVYLAGSRGSGLNWQGITTPYQPLAYGVFEEQKGYLGVVKGSSNQVISNGNDCYDLTKAEYTLYSDAACTKAVKIFRLTNVGGGGKVYDGPYEFPFGTYYLKETKAATGYALDPTVHTVKVEATGVTHPSGAYPNWKDFEVTNIPQSDPVNVLLRKVDADTGQSVPQGGASLAGAQFTFKFYAGSNPNLNGNATRTWVMKTDKDGFVKLLDEYKVSGDAFYTNSKGVPTLPLGTLTVQETKAPAGYYLNNQLYTVKITSNGTSEMVNTYNAPTVKEQVNDLILTKVQLGSNVAIPGTVFTWTKPDGKTEDIKTDGNGQIKMTGLATGIHKLKEKSVMDGYTVNPNEFSFEVAATGITAKTDTSGKNMTFTAGTTTGKSYQLTVEDGLENYDLKLIKVNEHDKLLPGAEFTLYSDAACTKVVATKTTDASGILIFDEIKDRTDYWFKETKAPEGYRIPVDSNGNQHIYKLRAEATPAKGQFDFFVDGTKYTVNNTSGDVHLEDVNGDKVVSITVINYTTGKLPETGSNGTLLLLGAGLAAVAGYFALNKKRKTN